MGKGTGNVKGSDAMYEADREGGEGVSEKVTLGLKIWSNWGHGPNRYLGMSVSRQRGEQLCWPSGRGWLACWENAKEATVPCMWAVGNEARERTWVEHRLRSCGPSEDTGCPAERAGKWLRVLNGAEAGSHWGCIRITFAAVCGRED